MTGYIVPALLFVASGVLLYDWRTDPQHSSPWFAVWVFATAIVALVAELLPIIVGGAVPAIFNTLRVFFDVIALCVIAILYALKR